MKSSSFNLFLMVFWVSILSFSCQKQKESTLSNTVIPDRGDHEYVNWAHYLGSPEVSHHSSLDQINTGNIAQLQVAWTYSCGDVDERDQSQIQCNPLIIDGILYGTSARLKAFALDAATGEELWIFDPFDGAFELFGWGVNRGLNYWTDGKESRILFAVGKYLFALDARTGQPVAGFGKKGRVDLRKGLDIKGHFWRATGDLFRKFPNIGRYDIRRIFDKDLFVIATSPGVVYRDLLILGTRVIETKGAAPGHIRAYNIRTGKKEWIFHTIPHPGEFGHDTWPKRAWKRAGGANAWAGMSIDTTRGMVFVPTGSATYDFYGGDRQGANLFANCLIALDAKTGKRRWHFQTVHHDLWDRDLPAPPNLVTIERNGQKIDAVAQITKSGFVFVFDRETGTPVFPIEEMPVPPSKLQGEQAWPTQPIPTAPPPFARQRLEEEDLTRRTPEAHEYVKSVWEKSLKGALFIPPSEEGTIILPGIDGGGEWGGAATDPEGMLYVNTSEMPFILEMVPNLKTGDNLVLAARGKAVYNANCIICHNKDLQGSSSYSTPSLVGVEDWLNEEEMKTIITEGKGTMPFFSNLADEDLDALIAFLSDPAQADEAAPVDQNEIKSNDWESAYLFTGYNRFKDQEGFPAITPPWGTLNAIDLNEGALKWKVPLGHHPLLPPTDSIPSGCENYGGPLVTAGNLLFIAATMDEKFRVFDKRNGQMLWEVDLPAAGYATPATYAIDGKQYLVIACGGGKLGTKSGDTYVAFTLPDS